jgi:hypothetical protein
MKIKTVDGVRVFPETDGKKLRAYWDRLSERQRNDFEKEIYYLKSGWQRRHEALCSMRLWRVSSGGAARRWFSMRELCGSEGRAA